MADTKVSALTELTTLNIADLLYVVDDPSGTPLSRKITMLNAAKAAMGLTSSEEFEIREVLHDSTLGAAGIFDVSSIPADYDTLELEVLIRSDVAATTDIAYIFFNNDTTVANYHRQTHASDGTADFNGESAVPKIADTSGASSPANLFTSVKITIVDYANTSSTKTAHSLYWVPYNTAAIFVGQSMVWWEDGGATAINRISIRPDGYATDEWIAGSRLRIIGVKTSS